MNSRDSFFLQPWEPSPPSKLPKSSLKSEQQWHKKTKWGTDQAQIPSLSDDIILLDVIKLLLPEVSVSTAINNIWRFQRFLIPEALLVYTSRNLRVS